MEDKKKLILCMFMLGAGIFLEAFDLLSDTLAVFLGGVFLAYVLGDLVECLIDNLRKKVRSDVALTKAIAQPGTVPPSGIPAPIDKKQINELKELIVRDREMKVNFPDSFNKQQQAQANQAALMSQGMTEMLKKLDHLTVKAGFEKV